MERSRAGQRHRGSLCLRNDDKSQVVWVALPAHESPCRDEEIYSPGRGIYNCLGLQKTLCAGTRSGSHADAPHAEAPVWGRRVPTGRPGRPWDTWGMCAWKSQPELPHSAQAGCPVC